MSKKRASTESNGDQKVNEGSHLAVFQPEDNAKREKLASLSGTTLQDLPIELLEYILVKVVAMEVSGLKLAKSVWKEKSGRVISRLRSVCSQWCSVLTTNFFRNELHRTLDRMAQEMIRMEMVSQSEIQQRISTVTTLKDEIFMHVWGEKIIVYDRSNMAELKDVIPLPGIMIVDIASCIVSNCVYVLGYDQNKECNCLSECYCLSVLRITKDEEHQFSILSPWVSDLRLSPFSNVSVSADSNLIIYSGKFKGPNPAVISIYDVNGSLQHTIVLSSDIYHYEIGRNILKKSNGNLVLVSLNDQHKTRLTEITMSGSIVRQYQSTLGYASAVGFADIYGRIVISEVSNRVELLDSELNLLNVIDAQLDGGELSHYHLLHYDSEKNEVVCIHSKNSHIKVLTIFRLTEE